MKKFKEILGLLFVYIFLGIFLFCVCWSVALFHFGSELSIFAILFFHVVFNTYLASFIYYLFKKEKRHPKLCIMTSVILYISQILLYISPPISFLFLIFTSSYFLFKK